MGTILFAIIAIVAVVNFSKWCDGQACGAAERNWDKAQHRLAMKYDDKLVDHWNFTEPKFENVGEKRYNEWVVEYNELRRQWNKPSTGDRGQIHTPEDYKEFKKKLGIWKD